MVWRILLAAVCAAMAVGLAPGPQRTARASDVSVEFLVGGLSQPTAIATPGDGNLYIAQKGGRVRIFDGAQLLPQDFLDVSSLMTLTHVEQGLLGLAFHPDFASNGYVYVHFTPTIDEVEVARFTVPPGSSTADLTSRTTVLSIPHPADKHFGGQLAFGPDGYLYIAVGDGGVPADHDNYAQRLDVLLGKILRIDVDSATPYAAPPDNPFVGVEGRDEIFAYGLRNPWRFSFDRVTGDMFIADVGEDSWEEVNFVPASSAGGENFGWRLKEGPACFAPPTDCDPGGLSDPAIFYANDGVNCSVTGGYRYTGSVAAAHGVYVYGDFCSGRIWGATTADGGATWSSTLLTETPFRISTFGEDADGEIYVVNYAGGALYHLDFALPDADGDGVPDGIDNCPDVHNPGQENNDGNLIVIPSRPFDDITRPHSDELGDACDDDDDNDGILDEHELGLGPGGPFADICPSASAPTDPFLLDTDGDRFHDGAECLLGSDPADAASAPDLSGPDADGDGLPDWVELLIGTNPNSIDSDGDGVPDGIEFLRYNTSPGALDTDGDGCEDGKEIASVNADRLVNSLDLLLIAQSFGASSSPAYELAFDVNKDGAINSLDLLFAAIHFGPCYGDISEDDAA